MSEAPVTVVSGPQESTHVEISTSPFLSQTSSKQTSLNDQKFAQVLQSNHPHNKTKIQTKRLYDTDAVQEIENMHEVGNMYEQNTPMNETHTQEQHNNNIYESAAAGTAAPARIFAGSPAPATSPGATAPPAFFRNANDGKPTSLIPQISGHGPREGSFKGDHRSPPGQPPSYGPYTGNQMMIEGDLAKVDLQASFAQSLKAWMSEEPRQRRSEPPAAPDFLMRQLEIGT